MPGSRKPPARESASLFLASLSFRYKLENPKTGVPLSLRQRSQFATLREGKCGFHRKIHNERSDQTMAKQLMWRSPATWKVSSCGFGKHRASARDRVLLE